MNKLFKKYVVFFFLTIISLGGSLPAMAKPTIEVDALRVILPPSVATSTAICGVIKNTGDELDTLIRISSNAGMVMLHKTELMSGHAQMNHIKTYIIESGGALSLQAMSYHLMIMGINHDAIKKNGEISLTLEFEKQGKLIFKIPVRLN